MMHTVLSLAAPPLRMHQPAATATTLGRQLGEVHSTQCDSLTLVTAGTGYLASETANCWNLHRAEIESDGKTCDQMLVYYADGPEYQVCTDRNGGCMKASSIESPSQVSRWDGHFL